MPEQAAPRPKIKYKPGYTPPRPGRPWPKRTRAEKNQKRTEKKFGITPDAVSAAIIKHKGLLSEAVEALNVPREVLVRYIKKNPNCLEALATARDHMGDIAEGRLFANIENGDIRCLLYYLSTVQRHRGYGQSNADAPENAMRNSPVFVETVNIIGVPSGTFLPPESVSRETLVIEHDKSTD